MKDQIVMSKTNGQCAVAVPLYRNHELDEGYSIKVIVREEKPLAYVIDGGKEMGVPKVMGARFVEKHLEFIGDL